jgi:hypothetical protein
MRDGVTLRAPDFARAPPSNLGFRPGNTGCRRLALRGGHRANGVPQSQIRTVGTRSESVQPLARRQRGRLHELWGPRYVVMLRAQSPHREEAPALRYAHWWSIRHTARCYLAAWEPSAKRATRGSAEGEGLERHRQAQCNRVIRALIPPKLPASKRTAGFSPEPHSCEAARLGLVRACPAIRITTSVGHIDNPEAMIMLRLQ